MATYQLTAGRIVSLSCIVCTKPFTYTTKSKGRHARFCGDDCRGTRRAQQMRTAKRGPAKRKSYIRPCIECGDEFASAIRTTMCCGPSCANARKKRESDKTRTANANARLSRECARCNAVFVMPRPSAKVLRGEAKSGIYCSRLCANDGVAYASKADAKRARKHRRRARFHCVPSERFASSEIFERDKWRCGVCLHLVDSALSHPHPMSASLDHVMPLSKGGSHTRGNTQCAHLRCNVAKGAKLAA